MAKLPMFVGYPKALAEAAPFGPYRAVVTHIRDGDTLDALVDLGWAVYPLFGVRLVGIQSPELRAEGGAAARDALRWLVPVGTPVVLATHGFDAYGRMVADIATVSTPDVSAALVRLGGATPWEAGGRA